MKTKKDEKFWKNAKKCENGPGRPKMAKIVIFEIFRIFFQNRFRETRKCPKSHFNQNYFIVGFSKKASKLIWVRSFVELALINLVLREAPWGPGPPKSEKTRNFRKKIFFFKNFSVFAKSANFEKSKKIENSAIWASYTRKWKKIYVAPCINVIIDKKMLLSWI